MYISRKTDYALILIGALKPTFRSGDFVPLKPIAGRYKLPYAYTEKLASALKRVGMLEARVGKGGGYRLARDPKRVTIQSIVDVFQTQPIVRCLESSDPKKSCALIATCPTRQGWNKADNEIRKTLNRLTLADV